MRISPLRPPRKGSSSAYRARLGLFACVVAVAAANAQRPDQSDCPRGALPAYAHNDYLNAHPLFDALSFGYQGVEADMFLVNGKLKLGHERPAAVKDGTLEALYLAPLRKLVARCGTLTADGQPFLLTLEIKEASRSTFDSLVAILARYPDLFSRDSTGTVPVQAVLVGWYPPGFADSVAVRLSRQARFQTSNGPPPDAGDYDVGLISLDYGATIGKRWRMPGQRRRWLAAVRATKAKFPARRIRALHVPVNENVYRDLLAAGVDVIGTLELAETARLLGDIAEQDKKR
jgi:hypothetical protein